MLPDSYCVNIKGLYANFGKGCGALQQNLIKNLEKVLKAFGKMEKLPKALIKYGCFIFLGLFLSGTVMVLLNYTVLTWNSYFDLVSKSLVKTSFTIGAEAIIGGLVLDFIFKK